MSKVAKRRLCPAVQREISSAECGENRGSRFACPAECAHNPTTPTRYDEFLVIEREVMHKAADFHVTASPNPGATLKEMARHSGKPPGERAALEMLVMFLQRDAQGRSLAQRWEAAGFPALNNDERVIFRAMMRPQFGLFEVRQILDDLRTEVANLLRPEAPPFTIHDRGLARQACRFACCLGWCYRLPHLVRLTGALSVLPQLGLFEPLEVATEIVRHLGGPSDVAQWPEWFARNAARFNDALEATGHARHVAMFSNTDMEFGKALYEVRAPFAECRDRLDATHDVAPDELTRGERDEGFASARVWFDDEPKHEPATPEAQPALGRVLLGQSHWRLEAMGAERLRQLRAKFDALLGETMRFTGERRDNLAAHLKSQTPKYDPALVPPRLLEQTQVLHFSTSRVLRPGAAPSPADFVADSPEQEDRAWLDNAVPALNDRTPREAAKDSSLRPMLLRLVKNRIRDIDEHNLREGADRDISFLARELGLHEIDLAAPPQRAPLLEAGHSDFDDDDDLEPPPSLPDEPFTAPEARDLLHVALEEFDTYLEAAEAMQDAGGFLADDAREILCDELNEVEISILQGYLTQLWFAFVPPGYEGPILEEEVLREQYEREVGAFQAQTGPKPEIHFEESPQYGMMLALIAQVARDKQDKELRHRIRDSARTLQLLMLKAAVTVLHNAMRNHPWSEPVATEEDEQDSLPMEIVSSESPASLPPTPGAAAASAPGSYPPPVDKLLTLGEVKMKVRNHQYVSLGITREHVPELIHMALDSTLHKGARHDPRIYAPVHAWRAIQELRAEEAIVPLLALWRRIDEDHDDWVGEELPGVYAALGPAAIAPLADYLAQKFQGTWARVGASNALAKIGEKHPEARAECVTRLTAQLDRFQEQDESVNAFLVSALLDLKAAESAEAIERAFAAGAVDESSVGDWEDVQIELGLKQERQRARQPNKLTELGEKLRTIYETNAKLDAVMDALPLAPAPLPYVASPKVGRNDPCPCGSGKKHKKCCGK